MKNDQDLSCRNESLQIMQKAFGVVGRDNKDLKSTSPRSKRLAIFAITNVLFKGYFKGNTLNLCQKLIDYIHKISGALNHLNLFSPSDVATYKYYLGRLRMFEDQYQEARDLLHAALKLTPRSAIANRQRILINLVPLEMSLGVMPSEAISRKYGLVELFHLGQAVRKGDVRTFEQVVKVLRIQKQFGEIFEVIHINQINSLYIYSKIQAMQVHQKLFIRIGIYLVLEKVKTIAYRNLMKRVYNLTKHQPNSTRYILLTFFSSLELAYHV